MPNPILEQFGPEITALDPISADWINTTPTPDVIFQDWDGASVTAILECYIFSNGGGGAFWERSLFLSNSRDPISADWINTTPTPDVIFQDWGGAHYDTILYGSGYDSGTVDPDVPLFAGDMGAYIG